MNSTATRVFPVPATQTTCDQPEILDDTIELFYLQAIASERDDYLQDWKRITWAILIT